MSNGEIKMPRRKKVKSEELETARQKFMGVKERSVADSELMDKLVLLANEIREASESTNSSVSITVTRITMDKRISDCVLHVPAVGGSMGLEGVEQLLFNTLCSLIKAVNVLDVQYPGGSIKKIIMRLPPISEEVLRCYLAASNSITQSYRNEVFRTKNKN